METLITRREPRSRTLAALLASAGCLVMVVGITYFAILVMTAHYGDPERRYAAFREIGIFLSGQGDLPWYRNALVYGALSLLLALGSLLFGVHPLARITLPVALIIYAVVHAFGPQLNELLIRWATSPP